MIDGRYDEVGIDGGNDLCEGARYLAWNHKMFVSA